MQRLRDENRVNTRAMNHVQFWFQKVIPLDGTGVLRLLFVFEMLINAFDFRRTRSPSERSLGASEMCLPLYGNGWDDKDEVQGWRNSLQWWTGKCGYCAGRGLNGPKINHRLRECNRGGRKQRSIRLGEAIFAEGYKVKGGCTSCGVPQEFCERWVRSESGLWKEKSFGKCQYGSLMYDTIIGFYQFTDSRYALDVLTTIEEEGQPEYSDMGDEDVTRWLCKKLV
jgi:hypothetical protein